MLFNVIAASLVCLVIASTDRRQPSRPSSVANETSQWRPAPQGQAVGARRDYRAVGFDYRDVLRAPIGGAPSLAFSEDNALRDSLRTASAGEGKEKRKNKGDSDEEDEERKTLSQQIADGKYGLIEKEIYERPPLRPGIISYKTNPEVPKDNIKNLGGLDAEEIWLAEDHVLVLRGGWFPNHSYNRSEVGSIWPPIDDYNAPPRQVKIPARPRVPPPFPIQLREGGPTQFIGPNGTRSQHPFPPPFFPFPPGDGFYPPPGNGSSYPPPPYPYPPEKNGSYYSPDNYRPPPEGEYPYPPGGPPNGYPPERPQDGYPPSFPYPPPPQGYMPFPNGTSPYGPLPPFFPPLPPGAAFLPPPGNQTEPDEDDPSIYYPPPYDFYYPQDNSTQVPPGPLVPGIILPPPPNFFAPLNDDRPRASQRPTSSPLPHVPLRPTSSRPNVPHRTPLPHVPFGIYPPTANPAQKHITQTQTPPTRTPYNIYPPTASVSDKPNTTPVPPYRTNLRPVTNAPTPLYYTNPTKLSTPPPIYYPLPRDPTTTPGPTPYGSHLPGPRPTAKRPYLTYVPVTTALRKKKPRPTTPKQPENEFVTTARPEPYTYPPEDIQRPEPPTFVVPQNVQVYHKGESPITVRPYYYDGQSDVGPSTEDNSITSTARPNFISDDSLTKLKDILYTPPTPSASYPLGPLTDIETDKNVPGRGQEVTTVEVVKSVEYATQPPSFGFRQTDFTKRPIYVQDVDSQKYVNELPSTADYREIDGNSVNPTAQPHRANQGTTPVSQYYQSQQDSRTPKATYYFYDEPHYEQGSYLGGVTTAKPYVYNPPKYQYQNVRPSQQSNYNVHANSLKTQEELLLAQIAATLRQPGTGYFYNSPNKQSQLAPDYYRGRNQQYYPNQRPNYENTSPRPGFYITKKPELYSTQTERPFRYNYGQESLVPTRNFPYHFEDTFQSTEHPLPKQYNTTPRPQFQRFVSPSRRPNSVVQTSPKTVYEYSFQQNQADTSNNYVQTERPKPRTPRVQSTTAGYYDDYSQNVTPDTNNQIYQSATSGPPRKYPVVQQPTPDPLQNYYTPQDGTELDDITKKYFTIFGQKLASKDGSRPAYGNVPTTTPLPPSVETRFPVRNNYEARPGSQKNNYEARPSPQKTYEVVKATEIPLYDDVAVNYRGQRPPINPDSEFINPELYDEDESDEGAGKLISYKLPGNEGGHFYFLTPQVAKQQRPQQQQQQQQRQQQQQQQQQQYRYSVPERGLRTRRNKSKQR